MLKGEYIARHYKRPGLTNLRRFLEDPAARVRYARPWVPMYRYRHNKRLRAAHLLDLRLGRRRG